MARKTLNVATEEYVLELIANIQTGGSIDLSNYAKLSDLDEIKEMFGGKSLCYITESDYNNLTDEEKNNETIFYIITDKQEISKISELENDLNFVTKEYVSELIDQSTGDYSSITIEEINEAINEVFND